MNNYLQRMQDAISEATRGMTTEQLTRHVGAKWSVAEILEHLDRIYQDTALNLGKCLSSGKPTASRQSIAHRLAVALVIDFGYMPSGRKSPEFAEPSGLPAEQVLRKLPEHIAEMDRVLDECGKRFGSRTRVADHFILGPLSPDQWRKLHWVHTRHHMKQIARLRRA
jgi:hypothetical protein